MFGHMLSTKAAAHRAVAVSVISNLLCVLPVMAANPGDAGLNAGSEPAHIALLPASCDVRHTIQGDEIVVKDRGGTVRFDIKAWNWAPHRLRIYEAMIDSTGYGSGTTGVLSPVFDGAVIDFNRPDYVFFGISSIPAIDRSTPDYRFGGLSFFAAQAPLDIGNHVYLGTFELSIPTEARGTFTVGFLGPDGQNTYLMDDDGAGTEINILPLSKDAARITILVDCNNNGIQDAEDISSATSLDLDLDGIPDECAGFVSGCEDDPSYSCPGNWDLEGDIPNNEGGEAYSPIIAGPDTIVCLDIDITVDTITIVDGSQLDATGIAECTGDITIAEPGGIVLSSGGSLFLGPGITVTEVSPPSGAGMTVAAGGSVVVADSIIELTGPMVVEPGGSFSPQPPTETNSAEIAVGSTVVVGGEPPGEIEITGTMSWTVADDMILDGSTGGTGPRPAGAFVAAAGSAADSPVFRVRNDAVVSVGRHLILLRSAVLEHISSLPIRLGGDFVNESLCPACFSMDSGRMELLGPGVHNFEVAGRDEGAAYGGFNVDGHSNFSIGRLNVAADAVVTFENSFANMDGDGDCQEALYVRNLTLGAGSSITLDNCRVYYEFLTDNGATISSVGCGALMQVLPGPLTASDAVCFNGATPTATPCGANADCPVGQACRLKSRFLSINPSDTAVAAIPTALQVKVVAVPNAPGAVNAAPYNYPAMVNDVWWVGAATNRVNDQSPYITAPLECTGSPLIQDWNAVGDIHIYGDGIVPGARYEIRSCMGVSGPCSAPLVLSTARHGDVRSLYNVTDFADISALVGEFSAPNAPSSLLKSSAWITPSNMTSAMGAPFGFNQISAGVTAFSGGAPPAPTVGANQCP